MSTSSARIPAKKIQVQCDCGKKYRISANKAGKKVTCKSCGEKFRIPRMTEVSDRSRGNILAELGIDPVAAEQAYKHEIERRTQKRTYRCTRCEGEIGAGDVKGAYVAGELVCTSCRASEAVVDRKAEREAEEKKARGGKAAVELITDHHDPAKATASGIGFGVLFLIGVLGPLWAVVGMGFLKAFGIALVVAAAGGGAVYRSRS
jgi:hypothetical protein